METSIEKELDSENEIVKWLKSSYQVSAFLTISRDKFHQTYAQFCTDNKLQDIGKRNLDSLTKRTFPGMKVKRNLNACKTRYHYGYCLELLHTENSVPSPQSHSEPNNGPVLPGDFERREKSHQLTVDWLNHNFEVNPAICLQRGTVYNCYAHFCQSKGHTPVIAATFGKISQKTFPHLTVRRLGQRNKSRYYCMGIDILQTSLHHHAISADRVQIGNGKPKLSRSFNGVRRSSPRVK